MATVYKARDDVLARAVAVKVLHPHLVEDAAFLERFRFEALAAARLAHPNIVSIYDTGSEQELGDGGERHFIVMEYCSEGSLSDHLALEGNLEVDRVRSIGVAVCDALGYAHLSGVVHRDIKPANVLVTADGSLKVADFGIAKAAFGAGDMTTTGAILGTVTYLSPEQLKGDEPDRRSDLYSLGVMLYELLAGRPPFNEETQMATALKHLRHEPPALRSLRAGIPRSLESVVMKALAKDPVDRFESAEAMAAALNGAGSSSAATAVMRVSTPVVRRPGRESTPPESSPPFSAARPLAPVLILIAVAAVAALVIAALLSARDNGGNAGEGNGGGGAGKQGPGASALDVAGVTDLDPAGDGEHTEEAPLAADGNASTAWGTSTYSSSLEAIGKSGVGLVFDLGDEAEVAEVTVVGCTGCALELRASDETSTDDESGFEVFDSAEDAPNKAIFTLDDPVTNRYWLVFITALPGGDGGSAALSEVTFVGP